MIRRFLLILGLLAAGLLTPVLVADEARADGVRPVQIQIMEREPGRFIVQWRVPGEIPPDAMPRPVLPDACDRVDESPPVKEPGGWLHRRVYHCPRGLAGQTVGVEYPVFNPALTALIRVELLSGERYVHALGPMETTWQVPAARAGAFAEVLIGARTAAVDGARHGLTRWAHVALLLVILLLGRAGRSLRLVTAFSGGQVAGFAGAALVGVALPPAAGEICVAVGVMFLAREASRPESARRRLAPITAVAGVFHGWALVGDTWWSPLAMIAGMDAAMLVAALGLGWLARTALRGRQPDRLRPVAHYLVGGGAAAVAFLIALTPTHEPAIAASRGGLPLGSSPAAGGRNAGRIAPTTIDAPLQIFVAVEPFEVRQEVLVRVRDFVDGFGGGIEVADQTAVVDRLAALVTTRTEVTIDGRAAEVLVDRASFVTSDPTGVLPRPSPVPETLADALVGVTLVYPTGGMPGAVTVAWNDFGDATAIPATIIDPESSLTGTLTTSEPALRWENSLLTDPTPTVSGVEVEPATIPIPLLSVVLLLLAVIRLVAALRHTGPAVAFATVRIVFAAALVAGTSAQWSMALPESLGRGMSPPEAQRVVAGLLPNVYRAFEVRDEDAVHDRLALTVTGDALTEIYLEQRQSLMIQARGGAKARVDAVELLDLEELEPADGGGFTARVSWSVGGTVTHFGHRHFRQNRYDARIGVVPVQGRWKLSSLEVLDLERVR